MSPAQLKFNTQDVVQWCARRINESAPWHSVGQLVADNDMQIDNGGDLSYEALASMTPTRLVSTTARRSFKRGHRFLTTGTPSTYF